MEQLISAATMPYWATMILSFLGGAFIGVLHCLLLEQFYWLQVFTAKTFTVDITIKLNPLSKMLLPRNILMQQNLDLN